MYAHIYMELNVKSSHKWIKMRKLRAGRG